jgi:hypothetical protein
MMALLKGRNGGSVVVNLDNVLFVDTMNTEAGPLLGYSAVVLGQQVSIRVKGTVEEVYGMLKRAEKNSPIEIAQ